MTQGKIMLLTVMALLLTGLQANGLAHPADSWRAAAAEPSATDLGAGVCATEVSLCAPTAGGVDRNAGPSARDDEPCNGPCRRGNFHDEPCNGPCRRGDLHLEPCDGPCQRPEVRPIP